ncbi:MAG: hypothetical protein EU981_04775 [Candidatus Liberibacter ctenarytainae]|uniref:Transmembrane protein n=1 Tax=Candidatus Liberibacter ctenarytainae TaxID=2020335 RepID=A0A937AG05_9HYPH|nr:hypothetical protein [Candidatus Liberibacter ctenarytainae]
MDSPETLKSKNSKRSTKKPKTAIPSDNDISNTVACIKNDLRDIKVDVREFRADIYTELKDASTVYSLLKNGNSRTFSSIQILKDLIEDNSNNTSKKIDKLSKYIRINRLIIIGYTLILITINLVLAYKYIIR